jgi:hypothetical protein
LGEVPAPGAAGAEVQVVGGRKGVCRIPPVVFGSELMSDELRRLRWAMILAQAASVGDVAAASSYGVSVRRLRDRKRTLKMDEGFRTLFEQTRRQLEALAVELRERRAEPGREASLDGSMRGLLRAVVASLSAVAAALNLPPVLAVVRPRQLPPRSIPICCSRTARGITRPSMGKREGVAQVNEKKATELWGPSRLSSHDLS